MLKTRDLQNEDERTGASLRAILLIPTIGGDWHMDSTFAEHFANDWIAAWNAHDLDRVLSHYANGFEMSSPYIVALAGEPSGTLNGKSAVGAYWRKALSLFPDLHFDLVSVLVGTNSITLYYKGARGRLVAEVLHFDAEQKVSRAFAHYDIKSVP